MLETLSQSALVDLHAEIWEGHSMAFDPDVSQDTRIRIAHQLDHVSNAHCNESAAGGGQPSGVNCRCNDLFYCQRPYHLFGSKCLPRW